MKNLLKISLAILLLTAISCGNKTKHEPDLLSQLPPATQEGKNTIGCIINGKQVYNTYDEPGNNITCHNWCQLYEGGLGGTRIMSTTCKGKDFSGIYIYIYAELIEGKTYQLGGTNYEAKAEVIKASVPIDNYYTNTNYTGTLTITKLNSSVVAGTFEFTVQGQYYPENTAVVTHGRFDLKRN